MAYEKTNWVDNETPINAANLNKMEAGIEEAGKTGGVSTGAVIGWTEEEIPEGYEENSTMLSAIANAFFPIGYTFIDTTGTIDYSNHLGLVWEKSLQGVTPIGQNANDTDFATVGKTGGNKSHSHTQAGWTGEVILSVAQMPIHNHGDRISWSGPSTVNTLGVNGVAVNPFNVSGYLGVDRSGGSTDSTGGSKPHAHTLGSTNSSSSLQPYQVVTFWTRVG